MAVSSRGIVGYERRDREGRREGARVQNKGMSQVAGGNVSVNPMLTCWHISSSSAKCTRAQTAQLTRSSQTKSCGVVYGGKEAAVMSEEWEKVVGVQLQCVWL